MDGWIWIILVAVVAIIAFFIWNNGKRNSDPLNRKCAAELCEYITAAGKIEPDEIREIFMRNARYNTDANHVATMVPVLLINAGYPRDQAMSIFPLLQSITQTIPR